MRAPTFKLAVFDIPPRAGETDYEKHIRLRQQSDFSDQKARYARVNACLKKHADALQLVEKELIEEHGAVSAPVAIAMAEGALELSHDDYAIAVTGVAGPGGGSKELPVGTVFLALAQYDHPTYVIRRHIRRGRKEFKFVVSQIALDMARRRMLEFSDLQDHF